MSMLDIYGNMYYTKSISGLLPGSIINVLPLILDYDNNNYLGSFVLLEKLNIGYIFCNLRNILNYKCVSTAPGSYCSLIYNDKASNLLHIIMPSGVNKIVSNNYTCYTGRISNEKSLNELYGKAGIRYNLGFRPSVRGVAMNPVDHPHGGRTKTNCPEKSPWGWVTKHSK